MGKRHEHTIDGIKEPRLPLSQDALGQQMSPNGGTNREKNGHHGNKGFLLPVEEVPGTTGGPGRLLWTDSRPAGREGRWSRKNVMWNQHISDAFPGSVWVGEAFVKWKSIENEANKPKKTRVRRAA